MKTLNFFEPKRRIEKTADPEDFRTLIKVKEFAFGGYCLKRALPKSLKSEVQGKLTLRLLWHDDKSGHMMKKGTPSHGFPFAFRG